MLATRLSTILAMVFAFIGCLCVICEIYYVSVRCLSISVCVYVCTVLGISHIMQTISYVLNIADCTVPYKFTATLTLCFGHLIHFVRFPAVCFLIAEVFK